MARVRTDFIAIPTEVYDILLDVLSEKDGVMLLEDIPLNRQVSCERRLNNIGFHVLKRKYVK